MGDFWKPTADLFTALIQRPKMTEKLLQKPPFKYLFDIIAETTNVTKFAQGLYVGEQQNGDYYGDKDRKIVYLSKIIKLVQDMSGTQVQAKPQKIIAGHQPQLTNLFLQQMYKCAISGTSSEPYVRRILNPNEEEPKPRVVRPPSAPRLKKPVQPEGQTVAQPQPQPPAQQPPVKQPAPSQQKPVQEEPKKQPAGNRKAQYSQKVNELQRQTAQQEAVVQKVTEQVAAPSQKGNINLGRLGKKKTQKVITATGQLNEKELQSVQAAIQSICQNTAPLGKSLEFIPDDIDSMNKELTFWRKQYNASKIKFQQELKVTEDTLMPVHDRIAEVQDQIADVKVRIQTMKAQVLKNDSTFKDLLMSVLTTK